MGPKTVFVDTQIFLHFKPIAQIEWCELLGAKPVTVVVAPIVISELDKKKIDKDPKMRKRASRAIRDIQDLIEGSESGTSAKLRENVDLVYCPVEPTDFANNQLDPSHPDDRLIASLFSYQNNYPQAECILLSEDAGCRLKANARKIQLLRMPDSLKLPEEPDPSEKRIRELEDEIRQLKQSVPNLALAFLGNTTKVEHSIRSDMSQPSDLLSLQQIKQRFPKIPDNFLESTSSRVAYRTISHRSNLDFLDSAKQKAIDKYNTNLDRYFLAYRSYHENAIANIRAMRNSISLNLILKNDGWSPAMDIRVILSFPNKISIYHNDAPPASPTEPPPPDKPDLHQVGRVSSGALFASEYDPCRNEPMIDMLAQFSGGNRSLVEDNLTIERRDDTLVSWSACKLQHGFDIAIPTLLVLLPQSESQSFQIDYKIHASNLRIPSGGTLNVIINL